MCGHFHQNLKFAALSMKVYSALKLVLGFACLISPLDVHLNGHVENMHFVVVKASLNLSICLMHMILH